MAKKNTTATKKTAPKKAVKKKSVKKAPVKKAVKAKKVDDIDLIDEEFVVPEEDITIETSEKKPIKKAPAKRKRSPKKAKKSTVKEKKTVRVFSNPMTSLSSIVQDTTAIKSKKEPEGKFELEYVIGTSIPILYEFISTPSGLSEWFADDVNIRDGVFSFNWEGSIQKAKLINFKENKFIKFQWLEKADGTYFEFKIEKDELTGDVSLLVVDFAEEQSDLTSSKLLWDSQISDLMHVSGSY